MKRSIIILFFLITTFVSQGQKLKTENVFIVTFDGFRWQELFSGADSALVLNKEYVQDPLGLKSLFWEDTAEKRRQTLLPFFWTTIATKGQLYGNRKHQNFVNCSNHMWFSYPGYNEILCGFADDERIKSNNKIDNPNVTVLEYLHKQPAYKNKVAAFGSWDVFPYIINTDRNGIPVNAGLTTSPAKELTEHEKLLNVLQAQMPDLWGGGMRFDGFTHQYALEYIQKKKPKVLFISYGETDDFAHAGKYDAYLKSAHQTDKFIAELWDIIQRDPQYKDKTTMIITTDHGRGTVPLETWRSHGTSIVGADQIWFAAIGPDTDATGEIKTPGQYYQNQVAKTAASFLGINYTNEKKPGDEIKPMIRKK